MTGSAGAGAMRYRVGWTAVQEDGSPITLHEECDSLDTAIRTRDDIARIDYVTEAWLERAEWQRFES